MQNVVNIVNLRKNFGSKCILKDVSLTMNNGIYGLLGRNGAGKTTMIRILATLLTKTSGDIEICGANISKAGQIRKIIGYLPQDFSLYPSLTVYEAMDYMATLSCIDNKIKSKQITELLEQVNLVEQRKTKIKHLSGGMKRRLGIAQVFLNQPKFVIMDEPTTGLDPEERVRFRVLLSEMAKNMIILLSTHITDDIEQLCNELAVLENGHIIFKGATQELLTKGDNKIYKVIAHTDELIRYKKDFLVTNFISKNNREIEMRIVSDNKPSPDAVLCSPTLEDAYMLICKEAEK